MYGVMLSSPSTWGYFRRWAGFALVVALCMGTVTVPGVWAATFYVDDTGDDGNTAAEAQSPSTPWKTITRAIGEPTLAPGDAIRVFAGTYDQTLGETFPLYLVDGVAIVGSLLLPSTRVIDPPPGSRAFSNDNTPLGVGTALMGFRLEHDTGLQGDALMEFLVDSVAMAPVIGSNVFVGNPSNQVSAIRINDDGEGARSFTGLIADNIFVDLGQTVTISVSERGATADFSPTVSSNTFTDCVNPVDLQIGAGFSGTASPLILNNTASGSVFDVEMEISLSSGHGPTVAPLIANNTFSGSSLKSIAASISSVWLDSTNDSLAFSPTIVNNSISDTEKAGIGFFFSSLNGCKLASDITIAGNTITDPNGAGISFEMSSITNGEAIAIDWTLSDNIVTFDPNDPAPGDGIQVSVYSNVKYLNGDNFDLTISGNTITDAQRGIDLTLSEFTGSELDMSLTLRGNTITGSVDDGVEITLSYQSSFTDSDVAILDNVVSGNGGDGFNTSITDYPSATSYVEVACNTITNNGENGFQEYSEAADAPPPDFGGGDLMSPGLNTLLGNPNYDLRHYSSDPLDAHSNWWGTTVDATIDSHIYDDDEYSSGAVQYSDWLSAAPTVSATASLTDALQNDLSPPGASFGDTIRYTATLEGTGDCGCASALFTAPIPANGTYVFESLTASRGILINEYVSAGHPALIVGLGALAAGETVTITWDVLAGDGCCLTSQATLSCYQLGNLLTDDPDAPGATDPTTVELDHLFCDGFESGDVSSW